MYNQSHDENIPDDPFINIVALNNNYWQEKINRNLQDDGNYKDGDIENKLELGGGVYRMITTTYMPSRKEIAFKILEELQQINFDKLGVIVLPVDSFIDSGKKKLSFRSRNRRNSKKNLQRDENEESEQYTNNGLKNGSRSGMKSIIVSPYPFREYYKQVHTLKVKGKNTTTALKAIAQVMKIFPYSEDLAYLITASIPGFDIEFVPTEVFNEYSSFLKILLEHFKPAFGDIIPSTIIIENSNWVSSRAQVYYTLKEPISETELGDQEYIEAIFPRVGV